MPIDTRLSEHGISFEGIVFYLQQGALLDDAEHPNSNKYPNQRVFFINMFQVACTILWLTKASKPVRKSL